MKRWNHRQWVIAKRAACERRAQRNLVPAYQTASRLVDSGIERDVLNAQAWSAWMRSMSDPLTRAQQRFYLLSRVRAIASWSELDR